MSSTSANIERFPRSVPSSSVPSVLGADGLAHPAILLIYTGTGSHIMASVNKVETEDEYIHVRFRDPDEFGEIRTPDWAENPAHSVSEGSEVRMGQAEGSDDWKVESVLIQKNVGEDKAEEQAKEIVEKIESE